MGALDYVSDLLDRSNSWVTQVEVDAKQNKLTVIGYVDPNKVLKRVRHRTGKKAELWPYVPYDVVPHIYARACTIRRRYQGM
ncbi:hypothetical protein HHK36_031186 [Tetracentron sinense]|uniref:Uncharacterized protein n=1 Tax=Tetracentron sinense TaxID=13715 RepID=A0A835D1G2_TETSI|nr:hypothetical protein HHK36_031186 [Tetracentron sinense]